MADIFDSWMGNPSSAWLRAWRQVDTILDASGQGNQVRKVICGAVMQAIDQLKRDTASQLQGDNYSRVHLMSNELIQLQKLLGQSCFGPLATKAQRAIATPRPISSAIVKGPAIAEPEEEESIEL